MAPGVPVHRQTLVLIRQVLFFLLEGFDLALQIVDLRAYVAKRVAYVVRVLVDTRWQRSDSVPAISKIVWGVVGQGFGCVLWGAVEFHCGSRPDV